MSDPLLRWLVRAALCTTAVAAQAQGGVSPHAAGLAVRSDPLDAKAAVPALIYRSPFARYRAWSDDKPVTWLEANQAVARIGGWRTYAREPQQPEAEPSGMHAPATPGGTEVPKPVSPGQSGHGGHRGHGSP